MSIEMKVPFSGEEWKNLKAGDTVYLTGTVYAARDAAHKRMAELMEEALREGRDPGEALPFPIRGNVIYYMGPSPARPGMVIGSAGPTTAGRMDKYTPQLLDMGLKGMIGKGRRSEEVYRSMSENGAVYMAAVGGAGALLSKCIKGSEIIAFEDLGPEAVRKLYVERFPVIVVADSSGKCLYSET